MTFLLSSILVLERLLGNKFYLTTPIHHYCACNMGTYLFMNLQQMKENR